MSKSAIVIGSGIVGLAITRALAMKNYKVTVIEKTQEPCGASIRNFGMIWPIGQPSNELYERALLSKSIWLDICKETKSWYSKSGSLHLASNELEENIINEFYETEKGIRPIKLINRDEIASNIKSVRQSAVRLGLYSMDEMIINPVTILINIRNYLQEKFSVKFISGYTVSNVNYPNIYFANEKLSADELFVCTGSDFETLYPEIFKKVPIVKCKLQMMRLSIKDDWWNMGCSLCGGLSLTHYKSFEIAPSIKLLKEYYKQTIPEYVKWGIHVMASQNETREITIGDSHEYGNSPTPFDRSEINDLVMSYLKSFTRFPSYDIKESWNGVYTKMTDGSTEFILEPESGVTIINGLGGAGMTLSFGLCDQLVSRMVSPLAY